jgi:hypothetical protein
MTLEQKKRMLKVLQSLREESTGNIGGETDIAYADNLVAEDEFTSTPSERNVVAKVFDTNADFDTYVNQRRGLEMTPKELQAISNYRQKPTQQDKFFIKYESTDEFGNNNTTIIKKLKDGNQFCWTAFSKNESAEEEGNPMKEAMPTPSKPSNMPSNPQNGGEAEVTVNDPIRIIKTRTFIDDNDGSNILSDFLEELDI